MTLNTFTHWGPMPSCKGEAKKNRISGIRVFASPIPVAVL